MNQHLLAKIFRFRPPGNLMEELEQALEFQMLPPFRIGLGPENSLPGWNVELCLKDGRRVVTKRDFRFCDIVVERERCRLRIRVYSTLDGKKYKPATCVRIKTTYCHIKENGADDWEGELTSESVFFKGIWNKTQCSTNHEIWHIHRFKKDTGVHYGFRLHQKFESFFDPDPSLPSIGFLIIPHMKLI